MNINLRLFTLIANLLMCCRICFSILILLNKSISVQYSLLVDRVWLPIVLLCSLETPASHMSNRQLQPTLRKCYVMVIRICIKFCISICIHPIYTHISIGIYRCDFDADSDDLKWRHILTCIPMTRPFTLQFIGASMSNSMPATPSSVSTMTQKVTLKL